MLVQHARITTCCNHVYRATAVFEKRQPQATDGVALHRNYANQGFDLGALAL